MVMTVGEFTKGLWIQQVPFRCSRNLSYKYLSNAVVTFSMVDISFFLVAGKMKAGVVRAYFFFEAASLSSVFSGKFLAASFSPMTHWWHCKGSLVLRFWHSFFSFSRMTGLGIHLLYWKEQFASNLTAACHGRAAGRGRRWFHLQTWLVKEENSLLKSDCRGRTFLATPGSKFRGPSVAPLGLQ